jgi:acyl carrier protein
MNDAEIKKVLRDYLERESVSNMNGIENSTKIFDVGLLDSMGLLFLIEFLNEKLDITISDEELNPENFESIDKISSFVSQKINANA